MDFIEMCNKKFFVEIEDVKKYESLFGKSKEPWSILGSNFLDDLLKNEPLLLDQVNKVLQKRKDELLLYDIHYENIKGKLLMYNPYDVMYDGLSKKYSNNFFNFNDVPPPEFWVGVSEDNLISFIPEKYFNQANEGVKMCISGALIWV